MGLRIGLRIGLLYSRFASMPQALWAALRADGHDVIRPEDLHIRTPMSAEDMAHFARLAAPDVIFCPFLKEVVPPEVCERTTTWIPHPGIRGDRGPSSLSWAILEGAPRWGLTMVRAEPARAADELDGGNVGPWREFAMPTGANMGEVYAQHIIPAAIDCAYEILAQMAVDPAYSGVPLASFGLAAVGRHRPALGQDRLAFTWDDRPDQILRHIRAAPFGVRTELGDQPVNAYDAHPHDVTGDRSKRLGTRADRPGQLLAHRDGAVLVATGAGGAVWIGHAKVKRGDGGQGLKLPAIHAVGAQLAGVGESVLPVGRLPGPHLRGRPLPPRGPGGMALRRALQRRRLDGVLRPATGRAAVRRQPGHQRDRPGRRQCRLEQRDPPRGHRGRR